MKDFEKKFTFSNENEPHKLRRTEMLKKHPEIRSLMGHDPHTKWICFAIVFSKCVYP